MSEQRLETPDFDLLARPYRWLEYMSMGATLETCRYYRLPAMAHAQRALVYGDGDGRFLARLLAANSSVRADVVDSSAAMLRLLETRVRNVGAESRVTLHHADALKFKPPADEFDLVASHFFLDCFTEEDLEALLKLVRPCLKTGAYWAISEFARPEGRVASWIGNATVSGLYRAFGVLTGLKVRKLPVYGPLLEGKGLVLNDRQTWLGGLLASEEWELVR